MPYPSSTPKTSASFATEFDILKASHKFLREDGDPAEAHNPSWNDQLAQKYYDNLFREFAVCDLKHYKSGNFALRWRTESEVLSGAGENSCGNTRCKHHNNQDTATQLTTLELPFAYEEHGERKSALVKVVLCPRCLKKLMWKRNTDKGGQAPTSTEEPIERGSEEGVRDAVDETGRPRRSRDNKRSKANGIKDASLLTRHRSSRSHSPKRRKDNHNIRRRSRSPE
ncbi:folate-sensitive fragile site protein Fra10Ac1-domain-containing protein [Lactarius psammicola]|nr:folate-sensitive fragile site protein Fra10Ac1-domain-containing protein [Lactarius psammicola]